MYFSGGAGLVSTAEDHFPKEQRVGVLMIQMQGGSAETRDDFQTAVMEAIIE